MVVASTFKVKVKFGSSDITTDEETIIVVAQNAIQAVRAALVLADTGWRVSALEEEHNVVHIHNAIV